jgi:beta-glucosidase
MPKLDFPGDFLWGAATASYQVEGATHEGGRSDSIWDTFSRTPGKVYGGENGDVACDQYHRYPEDVALMAELGFKSYRFSIAWPRIIPTGTGKVNPEGIAYYRALCAELHKHGISACATIYHWDLPQILQDKGGWTERFIVDAFAEFARVCFAELEDCVDQWITINEPYCVTYLGHRVGEHAPGTHLDINTTLRTVHHINLAHGAAVKAHRDAGLKTPIGITLNLSTPRPATRREADIRAAAIARAFESEVFLHPILGRGYPDIVTKHPGISLPVKDSDLALIAGKIDFLGLNYYSENPVVYDETAELKTSRVPDWQETSGMGWPLVPAGLGRQLHWVHELAPGLPLYITENGYARNDELDRKGRVHDQERIDYLKKHLEVCAEAIKAGINLKGYYAWSLLDNFEWSWGYTKRFGIVHVDYATQKRTPKDSAYFFRDVIAGYGEW